MFIYLHIYSKSYRALINFTDYLQDLIFDFKKLNVMSHHKNFFLKKTKIFAVLTSPHVNKTAQESFEQNNYKLLFKIYTNRSLLFLLFLKSCKNLLFFDVLLKVKIKNQSKKQKLKIKNKVNPDNYFITKNSDSVKKYLSIINSYGVLVLNSKHLFR